MPQKAGVGGPCGSSQDGPVKFVGLTWAHVGLFGLVVSEGIFTTGGGGKGHYKSSGFAVGLELGSAGTVGRAASLGDFSGQSDNYSLSFFGANGTWSKSSSAGRKYGSGGAGPSPLDLQVGGSISTTFTTIINIT
jgi:hypothetical protein